MKKNILILFVLLVALSLTLTGCGGDNDNDNQPETAASKAAAAKEAERQRLSAEEDARQEQYRKEQEWRAKPSVDKVMSKAWDLNVALATKLQALDKKYFYEDLPEQPAGPVVQIFKIGSDLAVYNEGTNPTVMFDQDYYLTELWTYHWNGGAGAPAGGIEMVATDGTTYGPWFTDIYNKVYWVAKPNQIIPAGNYTIIDSDPLTWAQNSETQGQGMTWASGLAVEK